MATKKNNAAVERPRGATRFGGITAFARGIGRSPTHVHQVLAGKRVSPRIVALAKAAGVVPRDYVPPQAG